MQKVARIWDILFPFLKLSGGSGCIHFIIHIYEVHLWQWVGFKDFLPGFKAISTFSVYKDPPRLYTVQRLVTRVSLYVGGDAAAHLSVG